jgi:AmmeMemoRadiSam system protein B
MRCVRVILCAGVCDARHEEVQVMSFGSKLLLCLLAAIFLSGTAALCADPTVQELLEKVGLKPHDDQRGQMDVVGFVTTSAQMNDVLAQDKKLAAPQKRLLEERYGWNDQTSFSAAVCPHDDYYYAGRLYTLLIPHIHAKRVILFGVFHKARIFKCKNVLVFDKYKTWHGPYGPVRVSPLREEIIKRLPKEDYTINNDMQMVEHSVEAIVPYLQAYDRDVEIVSILVPYMDWDKMDHLASDLSQTLAIILKEKEWKLGRDVALICSSDAVHYGDSDWGGSNFADFGTDAHGYQMAVERDRQLAQNHLCGTLKREELRKFLHACVDPNDVMKYRITWCGRFSVPFGLDVATRLAEALNMPPLEGTLLDYGTSISEASLDVEGLDGLGPTAPNNLHHFVGYAAIGYR